MADCDWTDGASYDGAGSRDIGSSWCFEGEMNDMMEELTTTFLACWRTTWLNPFMIIIVLIGKDLVLEGLRLSQVPGICPPLFFRTKKSCAGWQRSPFALT